MLYRLIKWATKVTQASKDHACEWDAPVAVMINLIFGIISGLMTTLTLIDGVLAACGVTSVFSLQVFAIIVASLLVMWGVSLRVVEIWLEAVDDKG